MAAPLLPTAPPSERDFRGPGCDDGCVMVEALLPGRFGRSELLVHDPGAHERHGRRQMGDPDLLVATGPLVLDVEGAGVTVDGRAVYPTAVELRLLFALAARLGRTVPSARLAAAVWGEAIIEEPSSAYLHALRVNMTRLRSRLHPAGGMIATALGVGYRLQDVARGEPAPAPSTTHANSIDGWSMRWAACRVCGLTDLPHEGRGYCTSCYGRGTPRPHRGRTGALMSTAAARRLAAATKETDR